MAITHRRSRLERAWEFVIEKLIALSGLACILFVILIFAFLVKEGIGTFKEVGVGEFVGGREWHPISNPPKFGILSLMFGSLLVTAGAAVISIPLGVAGAVYIAEVAPPKAKEWLKTGVELIAAIPSVVIGFVGLVVLAPFIRDILDLPTGQTAFAGCLMLSLMAMPTTVSIAEDAIAAVPRRYREAALALGATRWEYIWRVGLRAAGPGIVAAVMLGIGRVIGETMAVMMITGNAAQIKLSFFVPIRTMTATIAAEMGETVQGSEHYSALFAIAIVLFAITFAVNFVADMFLHKGREGRS